jgi:nucleoside-diphosphate-sugar epimerase
VVGGTRFVGYQLTWRLLAAGCQVTLFNRGQRGDPFLARVERLRGDRTTGDFARLLAGREFDAAVDFTAYRAEHTRQAVDVLGGGRVGHYVMISTGQVYLVRDSCPRPAQESDYDGPTIPAPPDSEEWKEWDYGMGKRGAEDVLAEAWAGSRFPATRLRIPMVNGERDHFRRLEGYLWRLLDGGPLLLPDGGEKPTRHVYGGAVAREILRLLGNPATFGRAYNLAQDETPTLAELVGTTAEVLGAPARIVAISSGRLREAGLDPLDVSPFSGRWMSFLDPSRAKEELGFRHEPLRHYLDKIVTAFLTHPPLEPPASYRGRAEELALASMIA